MSKEQKYRRFYVDWWTIRKSTIYGLLFFCLLAIGGFYGVRWLMEKYNPDAPQNRPVNAAVVKSFEGDVRIIRASTREIERVTGTTYVAAGDTVQTQADGKAQLQMIDGSTLTVRPNSTVVIRDNTSILGGTNVKTSLVGGQINVKTEDQSEDSQNIVEIKQVENKLASQTEASFGINQTTNTGEIRINRGTVESNAGGEKTLIKAEEFAAIAPNGKLSPKEKLLDAPKLIAPATLEQVFASDSGTMDITLRWQKSDNTPTAYYRAEVATSPFFVPETIIAEKEPLNSPNFKLANIPPGNYFWRVRSIATSGQPSEWSEPWKFTIATRDEAGPLSVSEWKSENISGNVYMVSGKTSPGANIRILGRETSASGDGHFRLQVAAASGQVNVELRDEHGGRTKYSLTLATGKASRVN